MTGLRQPLGNKLLQLYLQHTEFLNHKKKK